MTAELPALLLAALIAVESGGNDRAVGSGGARGCLQITDVARRDIERIAQIRIAKENLFDRELSCRYATIYLTHYATEKRLGRKPTPRDYALIWRHGPNGWKRKGVSSYWRKVEAQLSRLSEQQQRLPLHARIEESDKSAQPVDLQPFR